MMTENQNNKNSFKKLKRSILLKMAAVVLVSFAVGVCFLFLFVDGIFQAPFANFIMDTLANLGMGHDESLNFYHYIFRAKKDIWMLVGFMIIMTIAFYISLSRFTKHFDEIVGGVDELTEDGERQITLSPELDFMEDKLNEVNDRLRKKEKDARDAEQRKNDLVVYLAHDIKTPLTSVIGYLNLLNDEPNMSVENRAEYTSITLEKAYRLEELINEFFDITRFNLQTITLDKTTINVGLLINQVAEEFYPICEEKGLKLAIDVPDDLVIKGDSQKLARVINNIMRNAVLYSYDNQTVEVTGYSQNIGSTANEYIDQILDNANEHTQHTGKEVVLNITNTGDMIPQERLDSIFEKFYRLDQARSTNTGGSGLGLAIAKEIVLAHGGNICAESNENKTTFVITTP